jgi:hypothetical protein
MALYTFYPCRSDGAALCFEWFELESDASALARTAELFSRHKTSTFITVWHADRLVCSVPRDEPRVIRRRGHISSLGFRR